MKFTYRLTELIIRNTGEAKIHNNRIKQKGKKKRHQNNTLHLNEENNSVEAYTDIP
jgi:hypothetical protein